MDEYAKKLTERECARIRNEVKITCKQGREAFEDSQRVLEEHNAEAARLKAAIAIDPETARATDIDGFVAMCHKIVDLPYSPMPLNNALFDIMEIVGKPDYPREDREAIAGAFDYIRLRGHVDNCTGNLLYINANSLRRIDDPDESDESTHYQENTPLWSTDTMPYRSKRKRRIKPSPMRRT